MLARFWGKLVAFFLGGMLGTVFGVALGFFFFPYVFPPPPAAEQLTQADLMPPAAEQPTTLPAATEPSPAPPAAEQMAQAPAATSSAPATSPAPATPAPAAGAPVTQAAPVATGTFIHANKSDPVHWGKGKVSVYQRAVFLEPDFEVGPGPAFHVYLVPKPSIRSSSDMKNVMYVDLGRLRSFKGSQRYQVPDGVNLKDYPSVIIWCERFGVLISPADLKVVQAAN
jgi:Electron transfer DM13